VPDLIIPQPISAENSSQPAYDLTFRVEQLEKWARFHLGPRFAMSSLNIPHPELASLDARITALETAMATVTTIAYAAGRYL